MTAFWIAAAGLTALAWLMLAMPGGPRRDDATRPGGAGLQVLRDQLAALNAEFASGSIDAAEHREARADIERRVLEESHAGTLPADASSTAGVSRTTALWLAAALPLFAFGLYGFLGNLDGLAPPAPPASVAPAAREAGAEEVPPQAIADMLDDMARRMEQQPPGSTDAAGWALLARSNAALQRFDDASRAYARALALKPDDAQLLADQADVLSMLQGRSTRGEPAALIARALRVDPNNLKALALAGSDAFERKDFAAALAHWSKARDLAPAGNFADSLEGSLKAARAALGAPDALPPPAGGTVARLGGRVRIAPALASRVSPDDTVFVFARAENGPRMPLAIARYKASELPLDFRLDDNNAMSDAMRLSNFPRVVVGARVSRSGSATPNAGDLQGETGVVGNTRGDLELVIDGVRP